VVAKHEPNHFRGSSHVFRAAGSPGPSPTVEVRCCSKRSNVHSDYSPSNDLKPMTCLYLIHRIAPTLIWRLQQATSMTAPGGTGLESVLQHTILAASPHLLIQANDQHSNIHSNSHLFFKTPTWRMISRTRLTGAIVHWNLRPLNMPTLPHSLHAAVQLRKQMTNWANCLSPRQLTPARFHLARIYP